MKKEEVDDAMDAMGRATGCLLECIKQREFLLDLLRGDGDPRVFVTTGNPGVRAMLAIPRAEASAAIRATIALREECLAKARPTFDKLVAAIEELQSIAQSGGIAR